MMISRKRISVKRTVVRRPAPKHKPPTTLREAPGRTPISRWGAKLKPIHRSSLATRRDAVRSSDVVWSLVEKLMAGDTSAAVLLNVVIGQGFTSGKTSFVRITETGRKFRGQLIPEKVVEGHFAAITPGRQIVLFGITDRRDPATNTWARRGYVSRYKMGDSAVYAGRNIKNIGKITSISDKRVGIVDPTGLGSDHPKKTLLLVQGFYHYNWNPDTVKNALKNNDEWID